MATVQWSERLKGWVAPRLAATIAYSLRRTRHVPLRRFLVKGLFERYFRWRRVELMAKTAFGARMLLSLPDSTQSTILLTGRWEPRISDYVSASLSQGDIFVDVGANVGYYSLLAGQLVGGSGKVYAFEASPAIYTRLQHNVAMNGHGNVCMSNVAVSNAEGEVAIWSAPQGNQGHSTIIEGVARADGHVKEAVVTCDALPRLMPLADLLSARLIKIDIEGAERLAVEGIVTILRSFSDRTEWLIELSPAFAPGGLGDTDWVFDAFIDAGYSAYRIANSYDTLVTETLNTPLAPTRMASAPRDRLNDLLFTKGTPTFGAKAHAHDGHPPA